MIAWAIEAVIASTGLMLLVIVLRRPVAEHFGAHAAYALWALPALRMILPPMAVIGLGGFGSVTPMSAVEPVSGSISEIVSSSVSAGVIAAQPVAITSDALAQGGQGWIAIAVLLWLAGAALFLAGHVWGYRRFRAHLLIGAQDMGDVAPGIGLIASPQATGPMAFGLRRRLVVFPADASQRFDGEEHDLALAHELAHHRRGDLMANAFALVVVALHWWNPVAWMAYRLFRADQEIACDAQVVAEARRRGLGQVYGRALIKAATNREFAIACHMTSVDTLKRRLVMLSRSAPSAKRSRIGLMLIGGATLGGLALTASGQGVAADMSGRVAAALPASPVSRFIDRTIAPVARLAGGTTDAAAPSMIVPAAPAAPVAPPAPSAWADDVVPPSVPAAPSAPVPPAPPAPPSIASARVSAQHAEAAALIAERDAERVQRRAELQADQAERAAELVRAKAERRQADAERAQARAELAAQLAQEKAERDTDLAQARAERATDQAQARAERAADLAQARAERARSLAMVNVPRVTVTQNCTAAQSHPVRTIERRDNNGHRTITINVCGDAYARQARAQAISGLTQARVSVTSNGGMSQEIRTTIQRDLDREIARLRAQED